MNAGQLRAEKAGDAADYVRFYSRRIAPQVFVRIAFEPYTTTTTTNFDFIRPIDATV